MSSEKNAHQELKADIVVIGGGGSGLSAAVAAAELGASVVVLEKRSHLGGNANFAEGFFAAESPAQLRNHIYASRDECFRIAMNYSHWKIDARILRAFIDKSGDTVRWLESKGVDCNWIAPLYPNQVPLVWHCFKERGVAVMKVLRKCCEDLGVKILLETPAKKILIGTEGQVIGVLALSSGKELQIETGNVIIATGGYAGNKELLRKYAPLWNENMGCGGLPNEGDGLLMAIEAGAEMEGMGIIQLVGPGYPGPDRLNAVSTEPYTVWVNKEGRRFTDESTAYNIFESVNPVLLQPGRVCYSLMDDAMKQNIIKNGICKGAGIVIVPPGSPYPELETDLQLHSEKGGIKIAATWEEIAEWIMCDSSTLKQEIDMYNSFCDCGHDKIFTKDRRFLVPLRTPPFYAFKCSLGFLGTIGGIKINERMEVINREGEPIPGLYAAGVDTGGWESDTYCAILSGTTFGFALNSGRIAAENIVKSLKR